MEKKKTANKTYRFPKQEKPGLDLVLIKLGDTFGSNSLDVHNIIMDVMEEHGFAFENEIVRKALSSMAIRLVESMSNYNF